MSFKPGFESGEKESQCNTAGGSEFQVRGAAVLKRQLLSVQLQMIVNNAREGLQRQAVVKQKYVDINFISIKCIS